MTENQESTDNPAKPFWSGMDYIKDTIGCLGSPNGSGSFVVRNKSISLTMDEWGAIAKNYSNLEAVILEIWEEITRVADDLEEMKWLNIDDAEAFRRTCQTSTERVLGRLKCFVDNEKTEA